IWTGAGSQPDHAFPETSAYARSPEDTTGSANRVQEDTQGVGRSREDTASTWFGTVRPRVQIPGPRPISEYDPCVTPGLGRGPTGRRGRRAHLASGSRPPWRSRTQSCQPRAARTATPDSMARQI